MSAGHDLIGQLGVDGTLAELGVTLDELMSWAAVEQALVLRAQNRSSNPTRINPIPKAVDPLVSILADAARVERLLNEA